MSRNIYTHYKERLSKIGGDSKALCLNTLSTESACDVGNLLSGRNSKISEFSAFLFSDRKTEFTLISKKDKKELFDRLNRQEKQEKANKPPLANSEQAQRVSRECSKKWREKTKKELDSLLSSIKDIKLNCEDIERDTGRNELFIGFPFVFGSLCYAQYEIPVKAPLLLFPVRIKILEDETVLLQHDTNEKVMINPAFVSTYAIAKKIDPYSVKTSFDSLESFESIDNVIKYLKDNSISVDYFKSGNLFAFSKFKEPTVKNEFSTRLAAVLTRFSFTQPIYNDYIALERKKDTNEIIDTLTAPRLSPSVLLRKARTGIHKAVNAKKTSNHAYTLRALDFRQAEAVRKVGEGKSYVINTPPYTSCATVAAEMIADAICKRRKVLLVSDKKTSLDTIYNALGILKEKCVYINDEVTERADFYTSLLSKHKRALSMSPIDEKALESAHTAIACEIKEEEKRISSYFDVVNEGRAFGLSLTDMYASCSAISKHSSDYLLYEELMSESFFSSLDYTAISAAISEIQGSDLADDYYDFITEKQTNHIYAELLPDVGNETVSELIALVASLDNESPKAIEFSSNEKLKEAIEIYSKCTSTDSLLKNETGSRGRKKRNIEKENGEKQSELLALLNSVRENSAELEPLRQIFTPEGYSEALYSILTKNQVYIAKLEDALSKYEIMQAVEKLFLTTDKHVTDILDFAFKKAKDRIRYKEILEKVLPIRIYHELSRFEEAENEILCRSSSLCESRDRILKLDKEARGVALNLINVQEANVYASEYTQMTERDAYIAAISKKDDHRPIRHLLELYSDLITSLYPCWLLTPENVSSMLPLKKNLFDLVIFDGASQMFVEEAIPAAYRAKTAAVMGDGKQVHPSAEFMRRCLGNDADEESPTQNEKMKTESLYDVSEKVLPITKLTYHYGSNRSELMKFSSKAFYSTEIVIAPRIHRKQNRRPIELHTVNGEVVDNKCMHEAEEIIRILQEAAKKKHTAQGGIGIITFSKEQQDCIKQLLEEEINNSEELREFIQKEKCRTKDGEDASFFIKTVENAQGDKRDIIILSPALAKESIAQDSIDTGLDLETAINVSITRAKQKFILVTGISPESVIESDELRGGIYEKFLSYIKAAAFGTKSDIKTVLSEISEEIDVREPKRMLYPSISEQISEKLSGMGYTVRSYPGGKHAHISLAVYDDTKDTYLVGVILDDDALAFSDSALERDVYYPEYLKKMDWTILRITSREWWKEPKKVLTTIIEAAEYNRSDIKYT